MHDGPTVSVIFAVREMVLQEDVDKMLLTQETPLSGKTLCLICSLRVMPSFWRRATEAGQPKELPTGNTRSKYDRF
jgi:hypothetical protein